VNQDASLLLERLSNVLDAVRQVSYEKLYGARRQEYALARVFPVMFMASTDGICHQWLVLKLQREYILARLAQRFKDDGIQLNSEEFYQDAIAFRFLYSGLISYFQETGRESEYIADFLSEDYIVRLGYRFDYMEQSNVRLMEKYEHQLSSVGGDPISYLEQVWGFEKVPYWYFRIVGKSDGFAVKSLVAVFPIYGYEDVLNSGQKLTLFRTIRRIVSLARNYVIGALQMEGAILRDVSELLHFALLSAVAAVMARNMSHLLGSHIEPGIQNDMGSFMVAATESRYWSDSFSPGLRETLREKSISRIIAEQSVDSKQDVLDLSVAADEALGRHRSYRQRRMDLIARICTDWPAWGVGFDFYRMFVLRFIKNSVLLHFIGYSDGFSVLSLGFRVETDGTEIKECGKIGELTPVDFVPALGVVSASGTPTFRFETDEGYKPVIVWSRGGDMGIQAFHIVMENVIRNVIKHCGQARTEKRFDVGVFLFQDKESLLRRFSPPEGTEERLAAGSDYLYVVIGSSIDDSSICKDIDSHLRRPVVSPSGERDPEAWGIKEIKICAAFLANKSVASANDGSPSFVQAGAYDWGNGRRHLAYCLVIPRFYYLAVVGRYES